VLRFLWLCRLRGLNPFAGEISLIKYSDREPAQPVLSYHVFVERAQQDENFAGLEAGLVVQRGDELTEVQGTCPAPTDQVVGAWCRVYRKDVETPFYVSVRLNEVIQTRRDGQPMRPWRTMPCWMAWKVAVERCLRLAFPNVLSGVYGQEEFGMAPEAPEPEQPPQRAEPEPAQAEDTIDVEAVTEEEIAAAIEGEGNEQLISLPPSDIAMEQKFEQLYEQYTMLCNEAGLQPTARERMTIAGLRRAIAGVRKFIGKSDA